MIAICRTARNCQEACQRLTWPGEHGPHAIAAPSAGRAPRLAGKSPEAEESRNSPRKGYPRRSWTSYKIRLRGRLLPVTSESSLLERFHICGNLRPLVLILHLIP
jgi:hypothetical protein